MSEWKCALTLDAQRRVTGGSSQQLSTALRRGADLRIGTRFRHNEHIDTSSEREEPVDEVAEFGVTYLIDDRWSAGVMSLRQPVELPTGFGPRRDRARCIRRRRRSGRRLRLGASDQDRRVRPL